VRAMAWSVLLIFRSKSAVAFKLSGEPTLQNRNAVADQRQRGCHGAQPPGGGFDTGKQCGRAISQQQRQARGAAVDDCFGQRLGLPEQPFGLG